MTLVSVVGDFFSSVVPIFYEFKDKITTHIIISDDSKRDDKLARKFQRGVEDFIKRNNLKIKQHYYSIDEDSLESVEKSIDFILKNKEGELYVNTTDGLSSLNTIYSLRLLPQNAKIISYDMFDNEYHLISLNNIEKFKIKKSVPVLEHFKLKGVAINSKESKAFAELYENEIKSLFEEHHYEYRGFKYEITTKKKMPSRDNFPNVYYIFDKMKLTNRGLDREILFQKLTGDMFENYIYLLVKDLGFDDIEIGLEIEDDGVRNEFDLLLMKDNHLHVIECKHKTFKTLNIENIIYKYATLKQIVDEDAKAVVITLFNKYFPHYKARALSHNIALFNLNRNLKQQIKNFLIEGKLDDLYFEEIRKDSFREQNRDNSKRDRKTYKRYRK